MEKLTKEQLDEKLKKFITDPDWVYIEDLFIAYVIDLMNLDNIPNDLSSDQLAAEVRGRKLLAGRLVQFLNETKIIREEKTSKIIKTQSFK